MSEINRLIAEARGYKIVEEKPSYWTLRLNGDFIRSKEYAFDYEHDYEYDLNEAWVLFMELPDATLNHGTLADVMTLTWFTKVNGGYEVMKATDNTPPSVACMICEAWLVWKGIELPESSE